MTPATVVVSHETLCQLFHVQEACPGDIMNGDAYFSVQGPAKRLLPGCENAVGKLNQKW